MLTLREGLICSVALVCGAGCSGSLGTPRSDGGHDAAVAVDHPADLAVDADGYPTDGGGHLIDAGGGSDRYDGGPVCSPLVLAAQCPGGAEAECQPTWTDVLAHPYCMGPPAFLGPISRDLRYDCGGYHVRTIGHVDWAETYYYDIASGGLVAIYQWGNGRDNGCYGPVGGITTDCSNLQPTPICANDGGILTDGPIPDGAVDAEAASDARPD